MRSTNATWPHADRRAAGVIDLRILMARGLSVEQAAAELGIRRSTAYRWLEACGIRRPGS